MDDQSLPIGQVAISAVNFDRHPAPGQAVKVMKEVAASDFQTLEQIELAHIEKALSVFENNKSKAAQALGVTVKTLYNKLHYYGIFEKYASAK